MAMLRRPSVVGRPSSTISKLVCPVVSEKKIFDIVDDGRTPDAGACVYYKLTWLAFCSGELINRDLWLILTYFTAIHRLFNGNK